MKELNKTIQDLKKSSTSVIIYNFKSESCFSGVFGYPGLTVVGVLGSDDEVYICSQEVGLFHSLLCTGLARRELVSQEC